MNLHIEIRRNRSMQLSFKCTEDQKRFIEMMAAERPQFPPIPPEIQAKIDEANRRRIEAEGEVWKKIAEGKIKDLSGNIITPETHEICYDMEEMEHDGLHFMVSTQMYIQHKKSELQ